MGQAAVSQTTDNPWQIGTMTDKSALSELARLLALRVRRDVVSGLGGAYASRQRGAGLEFEELREYQPGDDARYLHWPSLLQRRTVTVRQFREEHERHDVIAVDVSRSMTVEAAKWQLGCETAALLCGCATLFGDGASLLLYSDCREGYVHLGTGEAQLRRGVRELVGVSPSGTATDLEGMLEALDGLLKKPSAVFIVSDLPKVPTALSRLSRRHDVTVCHICPSVLAELPPCGWADVRDAESGEARVLRVDAEAIRGREDGWRRAMRQEVLRAQARYCGIEKDSYSELLQSFSNVHQTGKE